MNIKNSLRSIFSNNHTIDIFIGKLLRYGCYTACIVALIGGIVYIIQGGEPLVHYLTSSNTNTFTGTAEYLREFNTLLPYVFEGDGAAIIQVGVVILIATPILRVMFSALAFWFEGDSLYVCFTLIVLTIIIANMILGIH